MDVSRDPFEQLHAQAQTRTETARQPFEVLNFEQLPTHKPPTIIEGLLRQEEILLMGGQAKRWKSWARLDLLYCVSNGMPWFGFPTHQASVLHIDLELHGATLRERLELIKDSYEQGDCGNIHVISARGKDFTVADLDLLKTYIQKNTYGILSLDPMYRLLGGKNENDAGIVTDLLNRFLSLGFSLKASIALLQHFAKGDSSAKESIDRFSGSGVWARFPDALMTFTDLETENAFSVEATLRDFPPTEPFAVRWEFPRFRIDADLDPEKLKERRSGRPKLSSAEKLCVIIGAQERISHLDLWRRAQELCAISKSTFDRRLREAKNRKLLYLSPLDGLYALSSEYLQRNGTSI